MGIGGKGGGGKRGEWEGEVRGGKGRRGEGKGKWEGARECQTSQKFYSAYAPGSVSPSAGCTVSYRS